MRILVTGSRGFVGQRVVALLSQRGHMPDPFIGDVRSASLPLIPRYDAIIHLAALISHRGAYSEKEMIDVNVAGTQRLVEAYPDVHLVYVSTLDVLRTNRSPYAESKLAAEQIVNRHTSACIIRLPSVFGPQQRQTSKLIPRLLRHYVAGDEKPALTDDTRPYVFVDDAAAVVVDGLARSGLMDVHGVLIHNRDLDELIRMAASAAPVPPLPADHQLLYCQLRHCVEAMRVPQTRDR